MVTPNIAFDFGTLPRDYGDVRAEARSCRSAAALFDFSFMSRLRIEGSGASALIAKLTARRVDDLPSGRIRYAPRIDDAGHVLGLFDQYRKAKPGSALYDKAMTVSPVGRFERTGRPNGGGGQARGQDCGICYCMVLRYCMYCT